MDPSPILDNTHTPPAPPPHYLHFARKPASASTTIIPTGNLTSEYLGKTSGAPVRQGHPIHAPDTLLPPARIHPRGVRVGQSPLRAHQRDPHTSLHAPAAVRARGRVAPLHAAGRRRRLPSQDEERRRARPPPGAGAARARQAAGYGARGGRLQVPQERHGVGGEGGACPSPSRGEGGEADQEVQAARCEFRFKDVSVDDAGRDGRDPRGTGWRYGLPFYDRKVGQVKIPTSVE